ncbi:transcription factor E2F7 isoform X3 [Lathamus discolor]|uniref:transcription factor E2F7 isoform X3 n=1 Tax=Lathamus discolor TaxID=678569 RepID=UPI0032B7FB0C
MEVSVLALRNLPSGRPGRRGRAEAAAQKENIFDRSRMAPKTPIKNEPVDLSKQKGCTPERNPITPVKLIDRPQPDPWTPTANLKMLISAASPDMRDREKKKELFRPIENSEQSDTPDLLQYDMVDDSTVDEFEKQRPSRKQKSLGLLCQKFLARYPSYPLSTEKTTISLDEVASILAKVRRLYDIANVLTSLGLIKKVHVTEERGRKPAFKWIGPVEFPGKTTNLGGLRGHSPTSDPLPGTQGACAPYQICATGRQRFTRHTSFNSTQSCEETRRKVGSEPSSPHQERQDAPNSYCSKMINPATVCRQKIEEDTRNEACSTETILKSARNPSVTSPLSLLSVPEDSEFCVNPLPQAVFPVVQTDVPSLSLPNGISSQAPYPSTLAASKTENGKPTLLPNQPFLCFPSSSLFMLCGGLQENNLRESLPSAGDVGNRNAEAQAAVPSAVCQKRSSHKCASPSAPVDDEEPATKKQTVEQRDLPLSLVVSKKPLESPKAESTPGSGCTSAVHLEAFRLDLTSPAAPEVSNKEPTKPLDSQEQEKGSQNKDPDDPSPGKAHISTESTNQPFLPQYLYVQSTAGLSGFNFLLPANQAPGAISLAASQIPSLSVPCVMLPSAALASFPLVCSPTITSPLPTVPDGSFSAATSMSFSMSSLASTAPVFIGTTAVVTPKVSPAPSVDPQQPAHPAQHLSPALPRSCGAVKLDSHVCMGHPVTLLKLQQPSSAPLTPKNIHPVRHEAFFKTPGSLGDPVAWKKNEGNQTRNASSVQRRLEISSSSPD